MKFVTGSNYPGYLPESEPRGPWNSWRDALADLSLLIEENYDEYEAGNESAMIEAEGEIALLQQMPPHDCDVIFIDRAFFIRIVND